MAGAPDFMRPVVSAIEPTSRTFEWLCMLGFDPLRRGCVSLDAVNFENSRKTRRANIREVHNHYCSSAQYVQQDLEHSHRRVQCALWEMKFQGD